MLVIRMNVSRFNYLVLKQTLKLEVPYVADVMVAVLISVHGFSRAHLKQTHRKVEVKRQVTIRYASNQTKVVKAYKIKNS